MRIFSRHALVSAITSLPIAMGISRTPRVQEALRNTWSQLDQRDIVRPSLMIRANIEMRYKLRQSDQIRVRVIPPEEYFDPLGPGETYAREGDPKFHNNHDYLDVDVAELEWTECIRRGAMDNTTLRTQFLEHVGCPITLRRLTPRNCSTCTVGCLMERSISYGFAGSARLRRENRVQPAVPN